MHTFFAMQSFHGAFLIYAGVTAITTGEDARTTRAYFLAAGVRIYGSIYYMFVIAGA